MTFPTRLETGYRSFLGETFVRERGRYERLATGQRPEIMVIGCCDSRVSPEVIFDVSPGEIFVARNVANLVPPYETSGKYHGASAAVEFAVLALQVKHIVVLGHEKCGGIEAFMAGGEPLSSGDFIGNWLSLLRPAFANVEKKGDFAQRRRALEQATIELSLTNLMSFPWVARLVERGELHLHGAYFGVGDGVLTVRSEDGEFRRLVR